MAFRRRRRSFRGRGRGRGRRRGFARFRRTRFKMRRGGRMRIGFRM